MSNRGQALQVHFSSATDEWATPPELFSQLNAVFHFTLDPCATPINAKCKRYFTIADDGLGQDWDGERVFMNPPYSRAIGDWVKNASEAKALVVCLLPARTDTKWWHDYVVGRGASVSFLKGRPRFGDAARARRFPAPFVIFTGSALTKTA
jgi:site-specific DNA-methyltransferase (adenine-specific)